MHLDAPARRITTWLSIVGYILVASGLPLPLGSVGAPAARDTAMARRIAAKDRSRPFPCMDKACGCDSAQRCFTSCCCHTPAETLAWARAHGVEPALFVALERRVSGDPPTGVPVVAAPTAPKSSCCSTAAPRAEPSCCSAAPTAAESVATENGPPAADEPSQRPLSRTVTLRAMLACGGIVAEWCAAGAAIPPPRVEVSLVMRMLEVCTPADEAGECLRASPAAPPPRVA